MIHTPVCDLLQIRHPIMLGGMAGSTSVPLVAAVSNAGGLGTLGIARTPAEQIQPQIGAIREGTKNPFGVNFLLFLAREPALDAALKTRPPVFSGVGMTTVLTIGTSAGFGVRPSSEVSSSSRKPSMRRLW